MARVVECAPAVIRLDPNFRGRSNTELAHDLYVSEGTVKTHVQAILTKLGPRVRVQGVDFAYDHGLVTPHR